MVNERLFRVFGALAAIALFLGSCLNPINFNEEDLPTINVNVSGGVDVTVKDVAVMWLINRTKTVDVVELKIERSKLPSETDEQYAYPKVYTGKPKAGTNGESSSLASYHTPTDLYYTISVITQNSGGGQKTEHPSFEVQFPRPQDYRYYLYWSVTGDLVLGDEGKMVDFPPDPDKNNPDPASSSLGAQTFVILNVSPDQDLDEVEFYKDPNTHVITGEPRAKDQKMIPLGSGSYVTRAAYTRGGSSHTTTEKNIVVTKEDGSMAVRTNFAYFYKTKNGDYQISQNWPPIPNDASDENRPEDALNEGQGILEITNGADPSLAHDIIARVDINGTEYPSSTNTLAYMVPGDVNRYILSVGTVYVSFRPTDQTHYGQTIPREIASKSVTKLVYTNNMGNPDFVPEDVEGYGAGLVRITNNTTGVVSGITVYDREEVSKAISVGYEEFTPPSPIQYGKVGRAPVYGTADAPLREGVSQIIQVSLETSDSFVVIERIAALRGQIVDIVIAQSDLNPGGGEQGRYGSKVTVRNTTTTSSTITGMYVYNKNAAASTAVYFLNLSSPPSSSEELYVLSAVGFPIVEGQEYGAKLSVYGNGKTALIDKTFEGDGYLYSKTPDSHTRTVTLTQQDLVDNDLVEIFVPVTGITPSSYTATSYTESDLDGSNPGVILGTFDLKNVVEILPANATTKGPVIWGSPSGSGASYVSLNSSTGILTVTGVAPEGSRTVTVPIKIEKAKGSAESKQDFTATLAITLAYSNISIRTKQVDGITLTSGVQLETGKSLNLNNLAALNPAGANINGAPIVPGDLTWTIVSPDSTGSSITGSTLTAGSSPGTVTVKATLPSSKNGGKEVTQTVVITIVQGNSGHIPITGVTLSSSSLPDLPFYTKNIVKDGTKTKIVYLGGEMFLGFSVTISPANATVQSPLRWSVVQNYGAWNKVDFIENTLVSNYPGTNNLIAKASIAPENGNSHYVPLNGISIPQDGDQVKVKASIANAGAGGTVPFETSEFPVTLREHFANNIVDLESDFHVNQKTITVGETVDLKDLAYLFPGATYSSSGNIYEITKNDLTWTIVSGGGNGNLNGSSLTGTAVGTIRVQATLPAAKNMGTQIIRTADITVTKPPYPSVVTLRLFKIKESGDPYNDKVTRIVLVPRTASYSTAVKSTGHTGLRWADGDKDVTFKSAFEKHYLSGLTSYNEYTDLNLKDGNYVDIGIQWPVNGATGYDIFFYEGDSRIRGYTNPWDWNPTGTDRKEKNLVFYLDFEYVYDRFLLPMNGKVQGLKGNAGVQEVIPIYYSSYRNLGAIMKSQGLGNPPLADNTDITH
jgi:hypothetical protein